MSQFFGVEGRETVASGVGEIDLVTPMIDDKDMPSLDPCLQALPNEEYGLDPIADGLERVEVHRVRSADEDGGSIPERSHVRLGCAILLEV